MEDNDQDVQSKSSKGSSGVPLVSPVVRVGRPPIKKRGVGRPKGDATILAEYRARMLNSPKSRKVLDKLFEVALNDEHPHQVQCLKIIADRLLPAASFAPEKTNTGLASISITMQTDSGIVNITAPNAPASDDDIIDGDEDITDGDFEEQE